MTKEEVFELIKEVIKELLHTDIIMYPAGSGKTTRLVKYALKFKNKKIIITTYTNKNLEEIKKKFYEINGFIPSNINITTWYTFLLDECCRPYQKLMGINDRINDIFFVQGDPARFIPERDTKRHYFNKEGAIYSDKIAKFAFKCMNKGSNVINRLEKITDYLFIDEAQDLSGFDFDILDKILTSNVKIIMVGDSRQNTFNTSNTNKNKKHTNNIYGWFKQKQEEAKKIGKPCEYLFEDNKPEFVEMQDYRKSLLELISKLIDFYKECDG